jgi:hypothetical protein
VIEPARAITALLAALLAAAATAGVATAATRLTDDDHHREGHGAYSIGLWGDLPYSDVQKTVGVPNLIADMNSHPLAFTANDGDIKSASSPCTDDVYTSFKATMNGLRAPAAFTPGDNDWTDCDRDGVHSSGERLDFERKLFLDPVDLRPAQVAPGGPGPALRREPPLDRGPRDLRDARRPGLVQQPL